MDKGDGDINDNQDSRNNAKIRQLSDEAAAQAKEQVLEQYMAFKYAREHWQPEQYEMLMYDGHQRRPWEWLLGFLDNKINIVAVPFLNIFNKTWFTPNNEITIQPDCAYWFAYGADAFKHFGTRGALSNYFLSNATYDWLVFYDEASNNLFFYGDQAVQWAHAVQDEFYSTLGLTHNDDIRLSDVSIEDWGFRLVLACRYQPADAELNYYYRMTMIFDDCRFTDWLPSLNLQGKPHNRSQRMWMYMGYRRKSGEMAVPALLDSYALAIRFTYREMVIVKD